MKKLLYIFLIFFSISSQAQVAWNVDSLSRWADPSESGDDQRSVYNEVWGYTANGREYGIIGSRRGVYIVDVTEPGSPEKVAFIAGRHSNGINRDYHDYNGYLYMVCDQGLSSLQIVDLHHLPDSAPLVYDSDELILRCHNIFIDSATAHLYACGITKPDSVRYDVVVYDLSESYIPKTLQSYRNDNSYLFHDIFVRNDTGIANEGRSGLFFYDFTDPDTVKVIASIENYPEDGYNHAGYSTEDNKHYYFGDETPGTDLKAVRLANFEDPEVTALFNSGRDEDKTVAHNLLVRDTLLFVSYYHEGLQLYSLSDPEQPAKIGHYITFTRTVENSSGEVVRDYSGYQGAWGVYPYLPSGNILLSDRDKGLFVFDISKALGTYDDKYRARFPNRVIFPNPVTDHVIFKYNIEDLIEYRIHDINGKIVERSSDFTNEYGMVRINFRKRLNAGVYILEIEGRNETFTEKIIKE